MLSIILTLKKIIFNINNYFFYRVSLKTNYFLTNVNYFYTNYIKASFSMLFTINLQDKISIDLSFNNPLVLFSFFTHIVFIKYFKFPSKFVAILPQYI